MSKFTSIKSTLRVQLMQDMFGADLEGHLEQKLADQQDCSGKAAPAGSVAYPTDPLMNDVLQSGQHCTAGHGAAKRITAVASGAGHDALAMSEFTKVWMVHLPS